jgi:hypothetical protein
LARLSRARTPGRTSANHRSQYARPTSCDANCHGGLADIKFFSELPPAALNCHLSQGLASTSCAGLD